MEQNFNPGLALIGVSGTGPWTFSLRRYTFFWLKKSLQYGDSRSRLSQIRRNFLSFEVYLAPVASSRGDFRLPCNLFTNPIACGESNLWPQFPVTLKTRVVEINVFNVYRILECVTINRKISATACMLQKNYPTYHMIRNPIVQSLSNMKNKSNDFLRCKATRHAVKTFLTHSPY